MSRLADLGPGWRTILFEKIWSGCTRSWDPAFDEEARRQIDQGLSRALTAITGDGRSSLEGSTLNCKISIGQIELARVFGRGDFRYGSNNLADYLVKSPTLDLVPIICSRTKNGYRVLDGHHRMRAGLIAGRKTILAITLTVTRGDGSISIV